MVAARFVFPWHRFRARAALESRYKSQIQVREFPRNFVSKYSTHLSPRRKRAWAWVFPLCPRSWMNTVDLSILPTGGAARALWSFSRSPHKPCRKRKLSPKADMSAILIVEDEARMRRLLELDLTEAGFQTFSAPDAEKGLELLRRERIDLVLTDLRLPGMSGLEFLQAAKRLSGTLPVVVMTAYGTVETAVEAMKAGAGDYVLKPFSLAGMRLGVQK